MKRKLIFSLSVFLMMTLGACSSSQTKEGDGSSDEAAASATPEAGTDAVPADVAEPPMATNDAAAPSPDAAASPAPDAMPPSASADAPPASPDTSATPAPMAEVAKAPEPTTPPPAADVPPPAAPETTASVPQTPPPVDMGSAGSETYTVQAGDTLMKIAFDTYGDLYQWKKIYEMNKDKISNPNSVPRGVVLKLEKSSSSVAVERSGDKYLIKNGDTLGKISDDIYGTKKKWKKIWEGNKALIKDPNRIFAGFYLYYTVTSEERQEADRLKQGRMTAPAPMAAQPASGGTSVSMDPAPMQAPVSPPAGGPVVTPANPDARVPAATN